MIKKVTITESKTGKYTIDLKGMSKAESIVAMCNAIAHFTGQFEKSTNQKPEPRPDHPPVTQAQLFIEE